MIYEPAAEKDLIPLEIRVKYYHDVEYLAQKYYQATRDLMSAYQVETWKALHVQVSAAEPDRTESEE